VRGLAGGRVIGDRLVREIAPLLFFEDSRINP
jgi:hypothetical protein